MKQTSKLIVTFPCSDKVHVYEHNSGLKPMFPYYIHNTMEDAIKYLKNQK